jgi:tetratricopeptide (TPR) repeat protein
MSTPLLVDFFKQLPERLGHKNGPAPLQHDAEGTAGEQARPALGAGEKAKARAALSAFKKRVVERYTEGTLLRLLTSHDARSRRAAAFALGLVGTLECNAPLAACLHDDDAEVPYFAADALWALWFRAEGASRGQELQRLAKLRDRQKALEGMGRIIEALPRFAEAYNQRAILLYRVQQFESSLADCEKALQLNPYHFGAQAGMGQCLLQLRRHKAALTAFRQALRINPHLDSVAEAVRELEDRLGE